MSSPATTTPTTPITSPATTVVTTPTASDLEHGQNDSPDPLPKEPTKDFHLDTFFNPVWMSGPNVLSFGKDGTVVRPGTYVAEPYPGYHADRRRFESGNSGRPQGTTRKDPKWWKNVAITEQDDEEYEAFQERMRTGALGEHRGQPPYTQAQHMMAGVPHTPGQPIPMSGAPGVWQGYPPYPIPQYGMPQGPYMVGHPYPMGGAPGVWQGYPPYPHWQYPMPMPEQPGFVYYAAHPPNPHGQQA